MAQRTKLKMLAIKYVAGERSLERSLENAGDFSDLFVASITRRIPPFRPTSIYERLLPCLCLLYTKRVSFDTNFITENCSLILPNLQICSFDSIYSIGRKFQNLLFHVLVSLKPYGLPRGFCRG